MGTVQCSLHTLQRPGEAWLSHIRRPLPWVKTNSPTWRVRYVDEREIRMERENGCWTPGCPGGSSASVNVQLSSDSLVLALAAGRALGCMKPLAKRRPEPGGHVFLTNEDRWTRAPRRAKALGM